MAFKMAFNVEMVTFIPISWEFTTMYQWTLNLAKVIFLKYFLFFRKSFNQKRGNQDKSLTRELAGLLTSTQKRSFWTCKSTSQPRNLDSHNAHWGRITWRILPGTRFWIHVQQMKVSWVPNWVQMLLEWGLCLKEQLGMDWPMHGKHWFGTENASNYHLGGNSYIPHSHIWNIEKKL